MKICTIFTGGTIGSVLGESGYIGPRGSSLFRVLNLYQDKYGTEMEFETIEPYRILSENLSAEYLLKLVESIRNILEKKSVDGIIVTHGTDTLQYGAAILGYIFGSIEIPIVLVSSNYVLEDERANGLVNFYTAVEFIKGNYGTGVFVSYCNEREEPTIHCATRLQPSIPYSDYVASVQNAWYGKFVDSEFVWNPEYFVVEKQSALLDWKARIHLTEDSGQILFIHPYVGMRYPEVTEDVKAVLHGSFHSGTICVNESFQRFMEEVNRKEIPVFLSGLLTGAHAYETVQEYKKMGVTPLHTSSEVAQYCKLWLALSNRLNVNDVMEKSIAGDWI